MKTRPAIVWRPVRRRDSEDFDTVVYAWPGHVVVSDRLQTRMLRDHDACAEYMRDFAPGYDLMQAWAFADAGRPLNAPTHHVRHGEAYQVNNTWCIEVDGGKVFFSAKRLPVSP